MSHQSLWIATAPATPRPRLTQDIEADVAIVGGGMLGITAAHMLQQVGRKVVVLEARQILEGVTGNTTAKLTSQHGIIYDRLAREVGDDKARLHADANEQAKGEVIRLIQELGVDAHLTRAPAYVYTTETGQVEEFRREAEAAQRLGLPAAFTTETELPFPVAAAVRFDDQAHFHPRKYLLALADRVERDGGAIHEQTPVLSLDEGRPCRLKTPDATVRAEHVIVATNVPINDRAYFTPRMEPRRAYGAAFDVQSPPLQGMYINHGSPTRSLRPFHAERGDMLVVVGENHHVGHHSDTQKHHETLRRFTKDHFGVGEPVFEWSTQDYYPVDGYPYIGKYTPTSKHMFTATGFQGWGMTQTTAAAMMLTQQIVGKESPWAELYDPFSPRRVIKDLVDPKFLATQAHIAKKFISERLVHQKAGHLAPGQGEIAQIDGKKLAVHRDQDGTLHARPAQCTHMGCYVAWNQGEQSWDCPCHGSRFAGDGGVLHGPATKALREEAVELPEAYARE